jgi:hypothetical protein
MHTLPREKEQVLLLCGVVLYGYSDSYSDSYLDFPQIELRVHG